MGSSVTAAEAIVSGRHSVVVNWFGGWHHGKRCVCACVCVCVCVCVLCVCVCACVCVCVSGLYAAYIPVLVHYCVVCVQHL